MLARLVIASPFIAITSHAGIDWWRSTASQRAARAAERRLVMRARCTFHVEPKRAEALPGTWQNPSDPSPTPRRRAA